MATDKKISALTDTTPASTDEVALQRSGSSNLRATLAEVVQYGGGVLAALFNVHTILAAASDDTPVALTVAEQTLVGRITGGQIDALTITEVLTLLGALYSSSALGTDNVLVKADGTGRAAQATGIVCDDSNNLTSLGTINSQRIPDGQSTTEVNATHTTSSADYNRVIPCSNVLGCTVTVQAGQGGTFVAFKATSAGQQITLTSGTCTIDVPEDYDQSGDAVSKCAGAIVGVLFDDGGTTGTAFGLMELAP